MTKGMQYGMNDHTYYTYYNYDVIIIINSTDDGRHIIGLDVICGLYLSQAHKNNY